MVAQNDESSRVIFGRAVPRPRRWLAPKSGSRIAARKPGGHGKGQSKGQSKGKKGSALEDAPGSYVKVRS